MVFFRPHEIPNGKLFQAWLNKYHGSEFVKQTELYTSSLLGYYGDDKNAFFNSLKIAAPHHPDSGNEATERILSMIISE